MKKVALITAAAIMMASCGGGSGDFATVGKKISMGGGIVNHTGDYYEDGKGYVINDRVAIPPIFDDLKFCIERMNGETFGSDYMIVEKDGKYGVVKMFQKKYVVPCDYEIVSVIPSKNFLFLKKQGEAMETFLLDDKKGWMGTDLFPPKKFPGEMPVKIISDPGYCKIVSLKCTGRENTTRITSTSYQFELVIESIRDLGRNPQSRITQAQYNSLTNFALYIENNGATNLDLRIDRIFYFPPMPVGQTTKLQFSVDDEKIRNINFTGFSLDKWR